MPNPLFTQKHYEAIAHCFKRADEIAEKDPYGCPPDYALDCVYNDLVEIFEKDNPNFNPEKFAKSCEEENS